MKRLGIATIGLVVGCALGWLLPSWIYRWDQIQISSIGPEATERLFQFFGLCIGGPVGFVLGSWLAVHWQAMETVEATAEVPTPEVQDTLG